MSEPETENLATSSGRTTPRPAESPTTTVESAEFTPAASETSHDIPPPDTYIFDSARYRPVECEIEAGRLEVISRDGDMILDVHNWANPTPTSFLVISQSLRVASSAHFQKSLPSEPRKTRRELQELMQCQEPAPVESDDACSIDAARLILQVLHFRYNELPKTVDVGQLEDLCVLANAWGVEMVLRPWVAVWARPHVGEVWNGTWPGQTEKALDWIFISYTFGFTEVFAKATARVAFGPTSFIMLPRNALPEVQRSILAERTRYVNTRRETISSRKELYISPDLESVQCSEDLLEHDQRVACDCLHAGHLARVIQLLWLDEDETWEGDLRELAQILLDTEPVYQTEHSDCGWFQYVKEEAQGLLNANCELDLSKFSDRAEILKSTSLLDTVLDPLCVTEKGSRYDLAS